MKTFVIGDIHGAYKAMIQAIERSPFNPKTDRLIQLGDVADGWSQTPEVVQYLLSLPECICIRGNHDEWTNQWMKTTQALTEWVTQGGKATKDAYENKNLDYNFDLNKHKNFFKYQHNYYIDDDNRLFVHGGITSLNGAGHETHQPTYFWDRTMWNTAMSGRRGYLQDAILPHVLRNHKEIFIGHTSTVAWGTDKPINACNVWNLDTGGGWHGKVTIMDVDTKEYWQSDLSKDLYPEENGR